MTNCPALNFLIDFLQGTLPPADREEVETHLAAGCRHCEEALGWLAEILEITSADRSFDFSEKTIARAVEQFKAQAKGGTGMRARFYGQLVFDSLKMEPQLGLRSGAMAGDEIASVKQVLYHAAGYDIDLRFELAETDGEDESFEDLIGQILPEDTSGGPVTYSVRLRDGSTELAQAQTSSQGIFKFSRIPSGVYDVVVEVPEGEVNIAQVSTARRS